jgi:hypothetical protein
MKRASIALLGGILIAALMPGLALAVLAPGSLDQSNAAGASNVTTSGRYAQTFTAGQTGVLTRVSLWASGSDPIGMRIWAVVGGKPDFSTDPLGLGTTETPDVTASWVDFLMNFSAPVTAGTQYAVVFTTTTNDSIFGSGDTYSGGKAWFDNDSGSFVAVGGALQDFGFRTYVDPQTTTLTWSKTQLTAGVPTELTLTEAFVFPAAVNRPGVAPAVQPAGKGLYGVPTIKVDEAPTFFVATKIACSTQIAKTDCKLSNETPGPGFPVVPDGDPVTITLSGIASPTAAGIGSSPSAAQGCIAYTGLVRAHDTTSCVEGQVPMVVVAVPTPTPPPTTTSAAASKDSGYPLAILAFGFSAAALGSLLVMKQRLGRSI